MNIPEIGRLYNGPEHRSQLCSVTTGYFTCHLVCVFVGIGKVPDSVLPVEQKPEHDYVQL